MLELKWDKKKPISQIRKDLGKTCAVPGCSNPLTIMQGPGSGVLCRDHQLGQREYGGMGRIDRPHTFQRKMQCEECGYNPFEDCSNKHYHLKETDPDLWHRLCRNKLIGDHQERKADGGDDSAANIKTLCLNCNSDKTIICEDYRPGR